MKYLLKILCICTVVLPATFNAQSIEWTKTFSNVVSTDMKTSAYDVQVYVCGSGTNTNFGGGHTLTGTSMYIAKFDTSGSCQWVQPVSITTTSSCQCIDGLGHTATGYGLNIAGFDGQGNILVYGAYCGSNIDFGNGVTANSCGYTLFIAKYNASGQCQWAKVKQEYYDASTSSPYGGIYAATVDKSGNTYIDIGSYVSGTFCGLSLASQKEYLMKINSSGNGVWSKLDANSTSGYGFTCLQSSKNIIYGGIQFSGTVSLGTNTVTSQGLDAALVKMDTAGNILASAICQTSGTDLSYNIAVSNNDVVLLGQSGSSTLTAGTHTLNTGSGQDQTFLLVCDTTSLTIQAINNVAGSSAGKGLGLYNDNKGNMYLRVYNSTTANFGSLSNISNGNHIIKIDNTLNYYWYIDINTTTLSPDTLGNIYATYSNLQLSKIKNAYATGGIGSRQLQTNQLQVYPNPSSSIFNLKLGTNIKNTNTINIYLYDVSGKEINALPYTRQDIYTLQIDLSNYSQGNYLLKAEIDGVWYSAKLER